jgi:hypothetical protein
MELIIKSCQFGITIKVRIGALMYFGGTRIRLLVADLACSGASHHASRGGQSLLARSRNAEAISAEPHLGHHI